MKKFLLSLLCLFAVGLSAKAAFVEKSFTLDFATTDNKKDGSSFSTSSAVADQLISGTEYVTGNFTEATNAYGKSELGLKLGASAKSGVCGFNFSDKGTVKITSIIINGSYYDNDKDANMCFNISLNGNSVGSVTGFEKYTTLTSKSLTLLTPIEAKSIKIETGNINGSVSSSNQARGYIKSITIEYQQDIEGSVDPEYTNIPENLTMTVGNSVNYPAIEPDELTYNFSVEPSDLVTFDEVNKKIIANKIGKGTITFTTEEVADIYNAGSGSFEINVVGKRPRLSFANQVVVAKLGTGVVWQIVDVTVPEGVMGDSDLVTYESSDPEIVSINHDNGQIKQLDIHKTGEVTITATFNPGDEYSDYTTASAKYTIIVRDPNEEISDGYSIFDFTTSNPYGLTSWDSNNSKYEKDADNPVTEIVGDEDVVTISFDNGSGNGYRAWNKGTNKGYDFRVYNDCKMKFEVPDGYKITKIGFVGNTWCLTPDPISASTSEEDKESDELEGKFGFLWLPNEGQAVSTVTFTNDIKTDKDKNQTCTIEKIEVLYESISSNLKSANLSFKKNVNGVIVDEEAEINAVTNPFGREIVYSIDGLDENLYTITPSADKKTIKVLVKEPGYYTLMAKSPAGDGYRDGLAIMRLNVFRHLVVYADDTVLTEEVISSKNGVYITMDVPPMANLYYKIEGSVPASKSKSIKAVEEEEEDENLEPGFELYEDGISIDKDHEGNLQFYIANYGYKSPVRTMAITKETAVEEIEAVAGEGEVRYFDLSGREVKGQPEKGLYIRLKGGKAEKVIR